VNSHNPEDDLPTPTAGRVSVDFYTQSRTVVIAADDTPIARFGA
jgi:hypothetical protein